MNIYGTSDKGRYRAENQDSFDICPVGGGTAPLPEDPVPAMAYVPFQQWGQIYEQEERALDAGTLFPVLDKPFFGREGAPR